MRTGLGFSLWDALDPTYTGTTIYDPSTGRYIGGSAGMDLYCSTIGALSGDPVCAIPSAAQIRGQLADEMAGTGLTPEQQAAALAAGDAILAADCAANPSNGAAQNAAALHPQLSAMIGPGTVAALFGIQCDGSTNLLQSFGLWLVVGGIAAIVLFKK